MKKNVCICITVSLGCTHKWTEHCISTIKKTYEKNKNDLSLNRAIYLATEMKILVSIKTFKISYKLNTRNNYQKNEQ